VRDYGNLHSTLEEVMEMVSSIHIEQLILGHFSSRYSPEEIDTAIKDLCEKYAISIPVHREKARERLILEAPDNVGGLVQAPDQSLTPSIAYFNHIPPNTGGLRHVRIKKQSL
jgi:hypothetical protein